MPMTMSQKILAAHAGLKEVKAGQLINARLDLVLANDITGPVAINEFKKAGAQSVSDGKKVALVMDHFAPNKDIKSAQQCKLCRDFAAEQGIENFFDVGEMGIEHALLPEKGLVGAGDLVIGADSHTCTYGALGAFSTGVGSTDMAAGMMTGMCWFKVPSAIKFVLHGKPAKNVCGKDLILHIIGMIGVDGALYKSMEFYGDGVKHLEYMNGRFKRSPAIFMADNDAEYDEEYEIDLSALRPTVSFPHLPENTKTPEEWGDIKIDQVVIGSCTNGRISDLRIAAKVLKNKHVKKGVRTIIIPATNEIYLQAVKEGLVETFIKAGAIVSTPTCGPCLGGHMGILAEGERCVSTTNRNFVGRMGHITSEIYLASPYVAAASAIAGKLAAPDEV